MFPEKLKIQNKTDKTFCTSRLERYVIKKKTRRFFLFYFFVTLGSTTQKIVFDTLNQNRMPDYKLLVLS